MENTQRADNFNSLDFIGEYVERIGRKTTESFIHAITGRFATLQAQQISYREMVSRTRLYDVYSNHASRKRAIVMHDRRANGKTYKAIGEEFDVSGGRVQQIISNYERKLYRVTNGGLR